MPMQHLRIFVTAFPEAHIQTAIPRLQAILYAGNRIIPCQNGYPAIPPFCSPVAELNGDPGLDRKRRQRSYSMKSHCAIFLLLSMHATFIMDDVYMRIDRAAQPGPINTVN